MKRLLSLALILSPWTITAGFIFGNFEAGGYRHLTGNRAEAASGTYPEVVCWTDPELGRICRRR